MPTIVQADYFLPIISVCTLVATGHAIIAMETLTLREGKIAMISS